MLACLGAIGYGDAVVGLPLSRFDGGFVPMPGADPDALSEVLAQWSSRRAILLQLCQRPLAAAIQQRIPHVVVRAHDKAPFISAQDAEGWVARRGNDLRTTTRSGRRRLQRDGGEITRVESGHLARIWSELADVERLGHRRHGHILRAPLVKVAFAALDHSGKVETWVIRLAGEITAYAITCISPTHVYIYTTAMRGDMTSYSLGFVLFESIVIEALRSGRSINLGPGRSEFKDRFTSDYVPLDDVALLPPAGRWATRGLRVAVRHKPLSRSVAG